MSGNPRTLEKPTGQARPVQRSTLLQRFCASSESDPSAKRLLRAPQLFGHLPRRFQKLADAELLQTLGEAICRHGYAQRCNSLALMIVHRGGNGGCIGCNLTQGDEIT